MSTATRTHEDQTADGLFARLDASIGELWAGAARRPFWRRIVSEGWDRAAYRRTMSQIFHYTRHNSVNQAAAAFRADPDDIALLRFVYGHAKDELGHERMALHDLKSAGLVARDAEADDVDPPLPATDALVNYLYGVALRDGPVPRLGYSYWAESVYPHIAPLLGAARSSLGLADRDMTFFVAHAEVDTGHAEQVRAAIRRAATTPARADAIHRVAVTSLWLTIELLEQAVRS